MTWRRVCWVRRLPFKSLKIDLVLSVLCLTISNSAPSSGFTAIFGIPISNTILIREQIKCLWSVSSVSLHEDIVEIVLLLCQQQKCMYLLSWIMEARSAMILCSTIIILSTYIQKRRDKYEVGFSWMEWIFVTVCTYVVKLQNFFFVKLIQFISRVFSILCTYMHTYEIFFLIILIRSKSNVYGQSVFFSCFKTLTRRSWHPSEWPIFDTKTFVSNFAASTVITNLLPGQKKIAKLFAQKSAGCCCRIFRWPPQALWRRFFSNQLNIILIVYKPKEMIIWTENDVSFFIEVLLPILLFFFSAGARTEQNKTTCKFNLLSRGGHQSSNIPLAFLIPRTKGGKFVGNFLNFFFLMYSQLNIWCPTSKKSNIKHHIHKYMSKIEFENTKNGSNDFFFESN